MKRTKTITIETHQVQIIRPHRLTDQPVEAWCVECAAQVAFVTPDAAAQLAGKTTRELYRLVEAGSLHFVETAQGQLWLCRTACQVLAGAS